MQAQIKESQKGSSDLGNNATLNVIDLFLTKVILENGGKEWNFIARFFYKHLGNDSNLLIVFYVQIMPDDFVMQLHRF